jgi:hypothetical protein
MDVGVAGFAHRRRPRRGLGHGEKGPDQGMNYTPTDEDRQRHADAA